MSREIAQGGDSWESVGSVLAHLEKQQLVPRLGLVEGMKTEAAKAIPEV